MLKTETAGIAVSAVSDVSAESDDRRAPSEPDGPPETSPTAGRDRRGALPSLTGLRWTAALLVFLYHVSVVQYYGGRPAHVWSSAFGAGNTGVSFFFILSGFVLSWSTPRSTRAFGFWRKRFARIYPLHLATALLALALAFTLAPGTKPDLDELVANLLLVHSWVGNGAFYQSVNPVSWSLACEAFFYFLFPLLIIPLRRIGGRGNQIVVAACIVLEFLIPATAGYLFPARSLNFLLYYFPFARLPEFVLGMALAQVVIAGRWRGPSLAVSVGITVTGYFLSYGVHADYRYYSCTAIGITCLIAAAARADLKGEPSAWRGSRSVRLGELSFAFYLIHILVMRTGEYVFRPHPQHGWLFGSLDVMASFTVSLGVAYLLHTYIEMPLHKLLKPGGSLSRAERQLTRHKSRTPSCG